MNNCHADKSALTKHTLKQECKKKLVKTPIVTYENDFKKRPCFALYLTNTAFNALHEMSSDIPSWIKRRNTCFSPNLQIL